jgi:threonine-phosphate decarboxylase
MNDHGGDIYRFAGTMLDFSSNINPLGVPVSFKMALRQRSADFGLYPDIACRALKQNIGAYLGVDPEWVIPGNGAVDNIYRAVKAAQKSRVCGVAPSFSEYRSAAENAGMEYREAEAFDEEYSRIRRDAMAKLAQADTTVILGNPNNPTGSLEDATGLSALATELAELNSILIVDEAFIEFTGETAEHTMLRFIGSHLNVIVIRAATKFFGLPGVRLGYAITGNPILRGRMSGMALPWNINAAAVIAAGVVFTDHAYINSTRTWMEREPQRFGERLQAVPNLKVYPAKANFYLVKSERADLDAYRLREEMIQRGILIRTPCGFGNLTPFHFRLAVKDRAKNEVLIKALREVLG